MNSEGIESSGQSAPLKAAFVWMFWGALLIAFFGLVAGYGSKVPYWDEWAYVPYVTGEKPVTLSWIFSFHNEHPIPLPRIIYVALAAITHGNARAAMYFNVALLGLISALCIIAARRLRGTPSYFDAIFPMLWLSWGQSFNALWGFQIPFVLGSFLLTYILLRFTKKDSLETGALPVCIALLALPLCGGNGFAAALPLLLAFLISGVRLIRKPEREKRQNGLLILIFAALTFGVCLAFGLRYTGLHPESRNTDALKLIRTAFQFLAMSVGPGAVQWWIMILRVLIWAILGGIAAIILRWKREPSDRGRMENLLLFGASLFCIGLAIGYARGATDPGAGLQSHYAILAAPLLVWLYMVYQICCRPVLAEFGQFILFLIICSIFASQIMIGLYQYVVPMHERSLTVMAEIHQGRTPAEIAEHHPAPEKDYVPAAEMEMLRKAGMGPYRK